MIEKWFPAVWTTAFLSVVLAGAICAEIYPIRHWEIVVGPIVIEGGAR